MVVAAGVALATAACGRSLPRSVGDPDPAAKIPGMTDAVADRDLSDLDRLIEDLESDDPAVRFYAIEALERLTGEANGYSYYADEDARRQGVRNWRQWLDERRAQSPAAGARMTK